MSAIAVVSTALGGAPETRVVPPPVEQVAVGWDPKIGCTVDVFLDAPRSLQTYAVYGTTAPRDMYIPPAYQFRPPFGGDVGAPDAFLTATTPLLDRDSFLTIGDGDRRRLSVVGVDFSAWSAARPLRVDDGALFVIDPDRSPRGRVRLARLTVTGAHVMQLQIQGQIYDPTSDAHSVAWTHGYRVPLQCEDQRSGH